MTVVPTQRLYIHTAPVVFAARINMASVSYPVSDLVYDGVTTGAYTDCEADMFFTLGSAAGLDDYGRGRLRSAPTSTILKVGRASQGTEDGSLDVVNDAWIHVYPDWRVHAKIPYITPSGTMYKDSDLSVGTLTTTPPPVANTGPGYADTIDSITSLITVTFDGTNSVAVADGATITTYAWGVDDGTITVGTAASSSITATFGPGFRWVALTVTDSLGSTHTARCPVFARDPDDDDCVQSWQFAGPITRTQAGTRASVQIFEDLPRSTYADGSLVMIWEDGIANPVLRDRLIFWGWHQSDRVAERSTETGLLRDTILECVDVAGRLDSLPGFPQTIEDDTLRDLTENPSITWAFMTTPNVDKYIHYLLQWHSTALALTDYTPSGTGTDYPFIIFQSEGASLFEQVDRRAKSIVPDHNFTCNRLGQLRVIVDPMLQNTADRTATVQGQFLEQSWAGLDFTYTRPPRVHRMYASAILTGTTEPIGTAFCIAPGTAPSQGTNEVTHGEQLAQSQSDLNDVTGHRYARANARHGLMTVQSASGSDQNIDPADMTWVQLVTSADTAPQRGMALGTSTRCLPREVQINFRYTETGIVQEATVTLEVETIGRPALTEVREAAAEVGEPPPVWVPPLLGNPAYYYGTVNAYVLWDGAHVMRTWDLQAASPVWELVDTGITGTIHDGQYVHVDADTVGMWLMTSTAIWWCGDIMATTPSWSAVLTIATVQAADVQIGGNATVFFAMNHYASAPGYLIVATAPANYATAGSFAYQHAYSWHTHDYGQTWQQIDMNGFLETASSNTSGYSWCGRYAIAIYASSPVIWMFRSTSNLQDKSAVFKSTDLGDTWTKEYAIAAFSGSVGDGASLLAPFPDIDGSSYANRGDPTGGTLNYPWLYVSSDAWATATQRTKLTNYRGLVFNLRVNSNTFAPDHVLAWWHRTADGQAVLFESTDAGVNWTELYDPGRLTTVVQTPNGWPPDTNVWIDVYRDNSTSVAAEVIRYTDDKFATTQDKRGNLAALITNWTGGYNGGFALPKVGPNA